MWLRIFVISLATLYIEAIKVPVQTANENVTKTVTIQEEEVIPIYYVSDAANIDSYLIPPDPHKPDEIIHQKVPTPATYLLPPAPDAKNEYYVKSIEPDEQTDWHPIIAVPQNLPEETTSFQENDHVKLQAIKQNFKKGKVLDSPIISIPSRNLLPPRKNAPNDFVAVPPSVELELPSEVIDHTLNNPPINFQMPVLRNPNKYPVTLPIQQHLTPVLYITPPKSLTSDYKNPTRLYPKKYHSEFVPIPIPVSQFADSSIKEEPTGNPTNEYFIHPDQINADPVNVPASEELPAEQEASETNYRNSEHDEYPKELKPPRNGKYGLKSNGERTEFRMHGMKGPHSYQFGYDTGKGSVDGDEQLIERCGRAEGTRRPGASQGRNAGSPNFKCFAANCKNRQFRYEERDNDGHVRGHYGYVDKLGKLRVVNYDADPQLGFRAEVPEEKE